MADNAAAVGKVAKLVQTRLPLELRESIYSYIWDDETIQKLDYSSIITKWRLHTCNNSTTEICLCNRENIPDFACEAVVGRPFAYGVVEWLYNNCKGIKLNSLADLFTFLHEDPFQVRLSPAWTRLRYLSIDIPLRCKQDPIVTPFDTQLAPLLKLASREKFCLNFDLTVPISSVSVRLPSIAEAVELLEPTVAALRKIATSTVTVQYRHGRYGTVELEHMLGRNQKQEWWRFWWRDMIPQMMRSMAVRRNSEGVWVRDSKPPIESKSSHPLRR
jgi:hypothetical protein